uniref:Uncharacterized protein n=1 Tax=Arundo donax TaxID=35708 RepID=A0A0A9FF57_ARUDO
MPSSPSTFLLLATESQFPPALPALWMPSVLICSSELDIHQHRHITDGEALNTSTSLYASIFLAKVIILLHDKQQRCGYGCGGVLGLAVQGQVRDPEAP